jgi:hypothetical protein
MQQHESQLKIGDWVKGKTKNGELIRGYIETVDLLQGTTKVYVIECDHAVTIGRTVETLIRWVKKIPDSSFEHEEQLKELIDVALLAKDEQWFMELSKRLTLVRKDSVGAVPSTKLNPSMQNQLGTNNL